MQLQYKKISLNMTPAEAFEAFEADILLESGEQIKDARYSFVCFAKRYLTFQENKNPFGVIQQILDKNKIEGPFPFNGGLIGYIGWDAFRYIESSLYCENKLDKHFAPFSLAEVREFIVFDNKTGDKYLVGEKDLNLNNKASDSDAPSYKTPFKINFLMGKNRFLENVNIAKEYIKKGDIFQVVLSQCFKTPYRHPVDVYSKLSRINPSCYQYIQKHKDNSGDIFYIVGSSPESLVKVKDNKVLSFPIAGSAPRGATPEQDTLNAKALLSDPKEIAEHIMLVDLARNDISKVIKPETLDISESFKIKTFSHIMHICSKVTGIQNANLSDIFKAVFPAGTLSGAPKIRAFEIIDELETLPRGVYGGAVGYFDYSGNMDFAITIRSAVITKNASYIQAGCGVVYDSDPNKEYFETLHKARAVLTALGLKDEVSFE